MTSLNHLLFALLIITIPPAYAQENTHRTFENQFGRVEVPTKPQCVVSLHDFSITIQLMELGVKPCGSVARKKLWQDPYFRGIENRFSTDGIRYVGGHSSPDFEAIAALKPDIIFGLSFHEKWRKKLSLIAPVVLLPAREEHISVWAKQLADIVGKTQQFNNQKKEYDWILSEFKRLTKTPENITITTLEIYKDTFQLIGRGGLDDVINDMGLERTDAYKTSKKGVNYSVERIGDFNSDIIIDTYEPLLDSREDTHDFRQSPQWTHLFAVKNKQFLYFNRSRYGESMGGAIGSAYLLFSHIVERDLVTQQVQ